MKTLLLEIGTEEIPAGYIEPALDALVSSLKEKLKNARINAGPGRIFGTPRKLCVEIKDVEEKQAPLALELLGPPEHVAFDENGKPTIAAKKFAEKAGVPVQELTLSETPKGRRLMGLKKESGQNTTDVLQKILPDAILGIPFPKTMKWADFSIRFARPIHGVLALFGDQVVSFQLENIQSGRLSQGHCFMSPGPIEIDQAENYAAWLEKAHVIVDFQTRRDLIEEKALEAALEKGGRPIKDDALLDIVKNLVEYPAVTAGRFDADFLKVPREVLITAMREHQKYFAVADDAGELLPVFIAVNNTRTRDMDLVAKGHERVLRARLADARFFYESDLEESCDARVEKLKNVLFQADLGSVHEKILRVEKIGEFICDAIESGPELKTHVRRAARLCKSDLVSRLVIEFPKLQGIMGGIYAAVEQEPPPVCDAVKEHYLPTHSGGDLPESAAGAILSVADKIDSICGCFAIGFAPTGASDPYALRRQGIGVIRIIKKEGFAFDLSDLIQKSLSFFPGKNPDRIAQEIYLFFKNRMDHILADQGISKDVIKAVTRVSAQRVPEVWQRAAALEKIKLEPDFQPLAAAVKRIVNIIKKADPAAFKSGNVDESLFEHDCESALFAAYQTVFAKITEKTGQNLYYEALLDAASLKKEVDDYFEGVMVMADDADVRANRLSLLKKLGEMFTIFADFSHLSV